MVIDSVVDPPHFDADLDSTYHPDEDPDADYYLMLMRIRIGIFNPERIRFWIQILTSK
jgi:hypothetical protein